MVSSIWQKDQKRKQTKPHSLVVSEAFGLQAPFSAAEALEEGLIHAAEAGEALEFFDAQRRTTVQNGLPELLPPVELLVVPQLPVASVRARVLALQQRKTDQPMLCSTVAMQTDSLSHVLSSCG